MKKLISLWNLFTKLSLIKKIAIVIVLIILGIFVFNRFRSKTSGFTFEKVTKSTVIDVVSESGNVAASSQFQVYSPATGYIAKLFVKNGDQVIVGQKLFEVKSTATADEKAAANAALIQARATLGTAKAQETALRATMYTNWQKYMSMAQNGTYQNGDLTPNTSNRLNNAEFQIMQDQWNSAQASYANQQTVVQGAEAALTSATLSYQSTQDRIVVAQIAGTVANLSLSEGDKVTAGNTTPVLFVGDFSKNSIKIALNEVDVNKIKIGESATIVFDAMRDQNYTGKVQMIDAIGTNTAGVITYNAIVSIDNVDVKIKPNMTATVAVETSRHENVLTVPNSAIKPYKGGKAVLVAGPSKDNPKAIFHYVPVTIGLKGVSTTEITSGLSEGMQVITGGITTAQLSQSTKTN